ncbi:MAG TPA: hypothetical protein VFT12_03840, partial [Thermoanaerobaculia bacterium]|nr:hypothetical protein [Thermoanaerobaculia bacterium]
YTTDDVPGAENSLWRTEFWLRNNGSTPVTLAPWTCDAQVCLPVHPVTRALMPNENLKNLPVLPSVAPGNPGRLLYVQRTRADQVSASLRLWDVSREATDAGTEVPVVRESDLHATTAHLTAVPLDGRFRLMLRVYEVLQREARFRVRVYPFEEGIGATDPFMDFELVASTPEEGTFRVTPAYAQRADIESLLLNPVPRPRHLRIEVEPLTPGSFFWAFVSVTNNDTQRVTLVTPQ